MSAPCPSEGGTVMLCCSDVASHPGLRRLGAQHLAEWEDSLWHAVQYGRDSLADLPVRAQKASRRQACSRIWRYQPAQPAIQPATAAA